LRGYSLPQPSPDHPKGPDDGLWPLWGRKSFIWRSRVRRLRGRRSRFDRRFYAVAALVLVAAIGGKVLGADDFHAYPTVAVGLEPATVALSAPIVLSGLAPRRRDA